MSRGPLALAGLATVLSRRQFVAMPLGLLILRMLPVGRGGHAHPEPRPGVTAEHVLADDKVGSKRGAKRAYAMAREIPEVADGVYCYCECDRTLGHRSLLSCFESDQAAGCAMCKEQMRLVHQLRKKGRPLAQIRAACDEEFG